MYYSEGYKNVMVYCDDDGFVYLRRVENVNLPEWDGVDTTVRPVVDSLPGEIHSKVWKFDSHWTKEKLDRLQLDVLY